MRDKDPYPVYTFYLLHREACLLLRDSILNGKGMTLDEVIEN